MPRVLVGPGWRPGKLWKSWGRGGELAPSTRQEPCYTAGPGTVHAQYALAAKPHIHAQLCAAAAASNATGGTLARGCPAAGRARMACRALRVSHDQRGTTSRWTHWQRRCSSAACRHHLLQPHGSRSRCSLLFCRTLRSAWLHTILEPAAAAAARGMGSTAADAAAARAAASGISSEEHEPSAAYVHLPFCKVSSAVSAASLLVLLRC